MWLIIIIIIIIIIIKINIIILVIIIIPCEIFISQNLMIFQKNLCDR